MKVETSLAMAVAVAADGKRCEVLAVVLVILVATQVFVVVDGCLVHFEILSAAPLNVTHLRGNR